MPSALGFVCDDLYTLEDVSVMANISLSAPFIPSSSASDMSNCQVHWLNTPAIVVVASCQPINQSGLTWNLFQTSGHHYTMEPFLWFYLWHLQETFCDAIDTPTHPLQKSPLASCHSLGVSCSWTLQLHIFLRSYLLLGISSAIYM